MSSDHPAIVIDHISKNYRIRRATERTTTFSEALAKRAKSPLKRAQRDDFLALKDVSLEISEGEAVGIIGRNGAGKSTLLKILSRVVTPTSGQVELYGRVGSLLEVGTGFHGELTGRENIWLNGAILGMPRRSIRNVFESIVEFSEIGQFLDTPVKRYSSGMYVRLAFAVAAHLNPDILVVDEVLAVGDAQFQKKCLSKMGDVAGKEGRTVLFVSHTMTAIQSICQRCIVLEQGEVVFDGPTGQAIETYLSMGETALQQGDATFDLASHGRRSGRSTMLQRLELRRADGTQSGSFRMGDPISFAIDVDGLKIPHHQVILRIYSETDALLTTVSTQQRPLEIYDSEGEQRQVVVTLPDINLIAGRYHVGVSLVSRAHRTRGGVLDLVERAGSFEVLPWDVFGTGFLGEQGRRIGVMFTDSEWEVHGDGLIGATPNNRLKSASGR